MKKLILILIIFFQFISCQLINAQQERLNNKDSIKPVKIGIGIDLLSVFTSGLMGPYITTGTFVIPVDIMDKFRIEPEVYFNREKSGDDFNKTFKIGFSSYGFIKLNNIKLLVGASVKYCNQYYEFGTSYKNDIKKLIFGPMVGAEYFLVDNFSLGINLGLVYELGKNKIDNNNIDKIRNFRTHSGFLIRFYF